MTPQLLQHRLCHVGAITLQPVSPFGMYASGQKKDARRLPALRLLLPLRQLPAASAAAAATQLHRVSPSLNDGGSSDDDSILAEIEHRIRLSAARNFAGSDYSDGSESESDPEELVPPRRNDSAVAAAL